LAFRWAAWLYKSRFEFDEKQLYSFFLFRALFQMREFLSHKKAPPVFTGGALLALKILLSSGCSSFLFFLFGNYCFSYVAWASRVVRELHRELTTT
jgi:hypothetical protein